MEREVNEGKFIEHAIFADNMYGTSKAAVHHVQTQGLICVLDIDIQGVKSMKETEFNSVYVFIQAPSLQELEKRLRHRGTESEETLKKRLNSAKIDMAYGQEPGNFDIIIVNEELEETYKKLNLF